MNNNKGFAIVTALGLLMILMIIVAVVSATSVAESKQGQMSISMAQARAIADSGEVYASAKIRSSAGQNGIGSILEPYSNENVIPESQWSIAPAAWASISTQIEQSLNSSFNNLDSSDALDNLGDADIVYIVDNFRGAQRTSNTQIYMVDYTVVSTGTTDKAVRRVENKGVFEIEFGYTPLSKFLFLVDDAAGNNGFFPTGTIFNGPVHANKRWGFLGQPQFLGGISTSANCAHYWSNHNWSRPCLNADSRPPVTVPVFANGFQRGVPEVEMPSNAISQKRASLGLDVNTMANPNKQTICGQLNILDPDCKNGSGNWRVPNGVYLPNDGGKISGGIYIEGNLNKLTMDGSSRDGIQKYTFVQSGITYEITVDYINDTTTMDRTPNPAPPEVDPVTYDGVPNGNINDTTGSTANGQVFVNGNIRDLRAPARTGAVNPPAGQAGNHPPSSNIPPALALETQLNITATGKIELKSDIVYECDPIMLSDSDYLTEFPRCAVDDLPTILGVMSLTNNIEMDKALPNDPYLWGSYLAGTNNRGLTVENYNTRPAQGTMRIFGGLLQDRDQYRGTWGWNGLNHGFIETFDFDNRLANGLLSPPNFPLSGDFQYVGTNPAQLSYKEY